MNTEMNHIWMLIYPVFGNTKIENNNNYKGYY